MTFTLVWLLVLGLLAFFVYKEKNGGSYNDWQIPLVLWALVTIGLVIACMIVAGAATSSNVSANNTHYVIDERIDQRDEYARLIRDELSADKYAELLAALPDDIDLAVLRDRAGRILALNQEIYNMELSITQQRKTTCDIVQNPWVPRFPFGIGLPDCELGRD